MSSVIDDLDLGKPRKTPHIQQSEASECGLACLAMVAGAHGYLTDLGSLRQQFSLSLKGATLKQLIDVAERIGFNARPLRGELDALAHLALPAILHWDLNHFVVLTKISGVGGRRRYHIHDPAGDFLALDRSQMSKHWTGVALELMKSESFQPKIEQRKLGITQLWSSMTGFWQTMRQILFLSIVIQAAALAAPFYLQISIDTAYPAFDTDLLLVLALGFGGLALINLITTWLRSLVLLNLNNALSYQIIVNLFRHLVRLPLPWFEKRHVGDIISRFGSTQPITQLLSNGMITSLIDGIMAFITLGLMYIYSPILASIALVSLLLYLLLRLAFFQALRFRNVSTITTAAAEQSVFIESMRGIAAVKAFGQEGNRQRLWQKKKADAINASVRLGRLSVGFDAMAQFIIAVERVIFIYLAVSYALNGTFSIGMIFAFQAYKQQFLDAGVRLIGQAINFKILQLHLTRIADIALSRQEDTGKEQMMETPDLGEPFELKNVGFSYGVGEPEVLAGLNLRIEPGEMIALIGPSGGGKTTLMKLMMGLFDPTYGQVLIGGRALSTFSKQAYRRRIGSIAQGDSLYAGSIAENIAFFDPEIDMEQVVKVAKLAHIDDDINAMPLRYDTLVGDMGSVLSGGQKQRVLLARALYPDPEILFMDEGTANLDQQSEDLVLSTLASLSITRIVIAHRPRAIHSANRAIVIAGGRANELAKQMPVQSIDDVLNAGRSV